MADTTPNYGFVIPSDDGTDLMDADLWRTPIGQIDTRFKTIADASATQGVWVTATGIVVCTDDSLTPIAGASVAAAEYMKIGKTVWYHGVANVGATAVPAGAAVTLPNSQAGVPAWRDQACGIFSVWGTTPPADQSGVAFMGASLDRLIIVALSTGYRGCPANHSLKWSVVYKVT